MPGCFKEEMQQRTQAFTLSVLSLCRLLHGCYEWEHVGKQLLRSASSVAANIRAAYHAKSSADFVAKYKLCEEKAVVACFWMDFIIDGNLLEKTDSLSQLRDEAHAIAALISKTCITLVTQPQKTET